MLPLLSAPLSTAVWSDACVCFLLDAESSPGLLARLLQPFARRDLVPDGVRSRRSGATMRVEITVHAVEPDVLNLIEGNLHQVVGVHSITRLRAHTL